MKRFRGKTLFVLMIASQSFVTGLVHADVAAGKVLYDARCVSCHGSLGAGDGPIAAALPAEMKPRNLQDGSYKYAVDEAKFQELLKKGGGSVGLNALMPPQPDLTDMQIKDLYEFVKSLKK